MKIKYLLMQLNVAKVARTALIIAHAARGTGDIALISPPAHAQIMQSALKLRVQLVVNLGLLHVTARPRKTRLLPFMVCHKADWVCPGAQQ